MQTPSLKRRDTMLLMQPVALKTREERQRLRAQGLRPIEIWVPDVHSESFRAEAHRQSLAVAASPGESDDQAFVDSVSDWSDSL